mmetsp:Transcript_66802/g.196071  ORF Transcript_66802/g.196071 Transcript_66802/m.196071 type:complete len:231 (+) Transcript_66802:837-1529(+)
MISMSLSSRSMRLWWSCSSDCKFVYSASALSFSFSKCDRRPPISARSALPFVTSCSASARSFRSRSINSKLSSSTFSGTGSVTSLTYASWLADSTILPMSGYGSDACSEASVAIAAALSGSPPRRVAPGSGDIPPRAPGKVAVACGFLFRKICSRAVTDSGGRPPDANCALKFCAEAASFSARTNSSCFICWPFTFAPKAASLSSASFSLEPESATSCMVCVITVLSSRL